MKPITFFRILAVLVLVLGCATSNITSTCKAPGATIKPYKKIMVVGIIREADRTIREQMEAHLVGDLNELGYQAFSSYAEYGPKAFEKLSEEQINDTLRNSGADAVFTVVLLNKEKERYYVPERIEYSPSFIYYSRFGGYYRTLYTRIESPGYYDVSTRYFWESNFYDLATNQLIYSVQTQSFDPSSSESLGHEYSNLIVQNMVTNHILAKQPATAPKAM